MRISSLFLATLLVFNVSFIFSRPSSHESCNSNKSSSHRSAAHAGVKGFVKEDGKILVFRAQPSWWLIPSGSALTALGAFIMHGAYHETNSRIHLSGSWSLKDIFPDLHKLLSRIRAHIPLPPITGKPAQAIKGAIGAGIAGSGAYVLFYSWLYNYINLSKPLIVMDREGLHHEGRDKIYWKDVKSVRVVHDTTFDWSNGTGKFEKKYALEIVDAYDRFMIPESAIAVTADTLRELIKNYYRTWSW